MRISNGEGLPGLLFGFLFTSTGLFAVFVAFGMILDGVGLIAFREKSEPAITWQLPIGVGLLLLIGTSHPACGSLLLWTLRTTFDRHNDRVTVRTGWLGTRRQSWKLSDCQSIVVRSNSRPGFRFGESDYEIVLQKTIGDKLVVAHVTRSQELAWAFAKRTAKFTGLSMNATPVNAKTIRQTE